MSTSSQESRTPCTMGIKVDVLLHEGEHWFKASDVTRHLAYANGPQAVLNFVKKKDRVPKKELVEDGGASIYINEAGLRALVRRSHKPNAEDLETWVALKMDELRGSGRRPTSGMQIQLLNENDLHYKVVAYLKRFYPHVLMIPGLGELQDTQEKRLDAWKKGYLGGTCDLLLCYPNASFCGFAIEFKTPLGLGVLKENQQKFLEGLATAGFKTLVSNDYDLICKEIVEYFAKCA
jgi:hypothetical protein